MTSPDGQPAKSTEFVQSRVLEDVAWSYSIRSHPSIRVETYSRPVYSHQLYTPKRKARIRRTIRKIRRVTTLPTDLEYHVRAYRRHVAKNGHLTCGTTR
jgi:hypothetical protein